jgi:RsiW-degrading membrane proteinase PrsW (M82 family)
MNMKNINNDDLSRFWLIVSNAVPPVGFYLYFKHRNQYPNKARKALQSAAIGVPIALVASYIFNNYILN